MNRLQLVKQIGRFCNLYIDEKGQYIQEFRFPQTLPNGGSHGLGMSCQVLCGHRLLRPHIGNVTCRGRLAWLGKIPSRLRVQPYTMYIWKDRPLSVLKDKLLSLVLPLIEAFLGS